MKFGYDWPSGFGEEDFSKWWTMDDDGRTTDHGYTLGKSYNRSPEVFNILAKLNNIQKIPLFDRNVLYIRSEYTNYPFDR